MSSFDFGPWSIVLQVGKMHMEVIIRWLIMQICPDLGFVNTIFSWKQNVEWLGSINSNPMFLLVPSIALQPSFQIFFKRVRCLWLRSLIDLIDLVWTMARRYLMITCYIKASKDSNWFFISLHIINLFAIPFEVW